MPRVASRTAPNVAKPAVLHQTLEIPSNQPAAEVEPNKRPDFWSYMKQLSAEEWKHHIVYLTREAPRTNIVGGGGGYLTKLMQPFDLEDIKQIYGGYEFSYIMNRDDKIMHSGKFRIEAAPIIDKTRESTGTTENGGGNGFAQQFLSMLREELERSRGANGADKGTTEKAVEMLSKASDKAMEVILKQVPQAGNAAPSNNNALIDKLLTAAIDRLLAPPPAPAALMDPMKQLETMLSIFTKIDEIRGSGGSSGRRDWKATLVDKGLDALPQVLDTFRETRDANVRIASERARAAEHLRAIQNPPGAPVRPSVMTPRATTAHPGAVSEPVVTVNSGLRTVPLDRAQQSETPAQTAPAEIFFETIDRNSQAYINLVKQTIVEMISRGDHGEQIIDYLDGAKPGYSNTFVEYSPEQLTAYFAMDPILRSAIEHQNWSEVLDEARQYILEPDATESKEEQELEPATAGARHKAGKPN